MTKSALSRRRGTRRAKRNWGPLLLWGAGLLVVGLLGGVILGIFLLEKSLPEDQQKLAKASVQKVKDTVKDKVQSRLRKRTKPPKQQQQHDKKHDDDDDDMYKAKRRRSHLNDHINNRHDVGSWQGAKKEFTDHVVQIGTSGSFPYYPSEARVSKTFDFRQWEPPGGKRFEEYKHGDSPYTFAPNESDDLARSRRYHVKKAMEHVWGGYEKYAFGEDELQPISKTGNKRWGGIGTTLVDSLDTLWLMGMKDEFYRARDWCKTHLDHDIHRSVSVFETTIRSLGGLLSAYDWSQDSVFLDQAKDLGARLFKAFNTPSGFPDSSVNLHSGSASDPGWSRGSAILSEGTTLQIEFRTLARWSGISKYKTESERVFERLDKMDGIADGLFPNQIQNHDKGLRPGNQKLTFGAMSDSFYEYMLKVWIQGGKTESLYRDMYDKSIQGMHDRLLSVSSPSGLVFIADENYGRMDYKMDHLVCFMGGLLALGAYTDPQGLDSERAQRDLKTAKALTYTCYQMYARMPTGISPEFIQFQEDEDFFAPRNAKHYLLRPETVESFFVLYHLTGDPVYREWGWEVFQSIEKYCKTEVGYGKLGDVEQTKRGPEDSMESFFLAETMKYLYLLFDPDTPIDLLHKHVFNTEAHPMRIFPVMDEDGVMDLLK